MNAPPVDPVPAAAPLTIGELSRRTGIGVATLRMWETRHGFPRAVRLASGHRRYDDAVVDQVRDVQRRRAAGSRLEAAIGEVTHGSGVTAESVFAELRSRHGLQPHRLRKSTLLALSWALEDECCARAQRPYLFGAFQYGTFFRRAERRWRDLAATARGAWVLADFAETPPSRQPPTGPLVEVDLPDDTAMRREWALVCLAPDLPAALAAWEIPGQQAVADADRLFEAVWTLEPGAVRDAARCCARVVAGQGHDVTAVVSAADRSDHGGGDLREAVSLFNRVVAYVDRVR